MMNPIQQIQQAYIVDPNAIIFLDAYYPLRDKILNRSLIKVIYFPYDHSYIKTNLLAVEKNRSFPKVILSNEIVNFWLFDKNYHPPLLINWEYISEEYKKTILGTL